MKKILFTLLTGCLVLGFIFIPTNVDGQTIKIACAQMYYGSNFDQNVSALVQIIHVAADSGADLVLTPEAMMTDYKNGINIKQDWMNQKLELIKAACAERNIGAVVSGNRVEGSNIYICAYLIGKDGKLIGTYDKAGLLHDETSVGFTKGMSYPVYDFEHNGQMVKVGMQICRDQKYFAGFRLLAMKGAKILLHIAAAISNPDLPGERESIHAEMRTRAVSNSVFVASVNKAGNFQILRSHIWDPQGRTLAKTTDAGVRMIYAVLDLSLADHANLNLIRSELYELKEK
jgi:predicted amidohydrolase